MYFISSYQIKISEIFWRFMLPCMFIGEINVYTGVCHFHSDLIMTRSVELRP